MKTIKFFSSMGVTPGFFHKNEASFTISPEKIVAPIWQKHAKVIYDLMGIYPSAIIAPVTVVYHTEWGCPEGGEYIVSITGEYNPMFMKSGPSNYQTAVRMCLYEVAKELKQESTQVTFQEMEFDYIDLRKKSQDD